MIDIAFCFDEHMVFPACVAIASLLDASVKKRDHYAISCVCTEKAMRQKHRLIDIVKTRDEESDIQFFEAPKQFQKGYEVREITNSAYTRLLLHRIFPSKEKLIYTDVDVLFQDSMYPVWQQDIGDSLFAAVKGANNLQEKWREFMQRDYAQELAGTEGKYINSGVLLMNLRAIREKNPDECWIKMSERNYAYLDQDIINITCKDQICFLDLRFNIPAHLEKDRLLRFADEGLYSKEQYTDAMEHPAVIHYTGMKPWKNRGVNKAEMWWKYVDSQKDLKILFDKTNIPNRKTTGLMGKINRHLFFRQ